MSAREAGLDRTITGLGRPRVVAAQRGGVHPDARRPINANRGTAPVATPIPVNAHAVAAPLADVPHPKRSRAAQLNVAIEADARARLRAVYRATARLEGYRSFAAFVEATLAREAQRLESLYNSGHPFPGGSQRLTAGRPLGD